MIAVLVDVRLPIEDETTLETVLAAIATDGKPYSVHAEDANTARTFRQVTRRLPGFSRLFTSADAFLLDAEQAAVLFESLVDFQSKPTTCDIDRDIHGGKRGFEGFCDCDKRNRAWGWAIQIAAHYGVPVF